MNQVFIFVPKISLPPKHCFFIHKMMIYLQLMYNVFFQNCKINLSRFVDIGSF